jgi:DNA polymerase elongation subunit (family B)
VSEKAKEQAVAIFHKYAGALERHDVAASDLLIRRRLSKELDAYSSRRQLSVNAAEKLNGEGLRLRAGQTISYVITRFRSSGRQRALPEEMIGGGGVEYDSRRYVELLAECCSTILSPFGITKEFLLSRSELLQRN